MTAVPPELEVEGTENFRLNLEEALHILSEEGSLSYILKNYEPRPQQKKMLQAIVEAFNEEHIALIEAGTGTGKSLAYLIPAILWARKTGQRTVISTHTIHLQEQLLSKDIPLLSKALKTEIKAILVKGMGNYLCLRKMGDLRKEWMFLSVQEADEVEKIETWSRSTADGSRSSLPIVPSASTWEKVSAEFDTCTRKQCGHYKECFFVKARRQAADANILVVNHHLLFSDLAKKNDGVEETMILPPYTRVVIDEAHHIEDVATDFFARRTSYLGILHTISKLSTEKQDKDAGKLPLLKHAIQLFWKKRVPSEGQVLLTRLTQELPELRSKFLTQVNLLFNTFHDFAHRLTEKNKNSTGEDAPGAEGRLRLLPQHQKHPTWENTLLPQAKETIEACQGYVLSLLFLEKDINEVDDERFSDMTKGFLSEITAYANRLDHAIQVLKSFIDLQTLVNRVRWIENQTLSTSQNTHLIDADLDIAQPMIKSLFSQFPTVVLCSATLTTNHKFDYFRSRIGLLPELLDERKVLEYICDSPFDYHKQALLTVPTDMPNPLDPAFITKAAQCILDTVQTSRGNAFVLFTSYQMLRACHELLAERLKENRFHVLKQGDFPRQTLLNKFRLVDRSVLFGTDSFWEGVDVAGEALRCVIIVKLPFRVPSEPIIQARSEAIALKGGDPFQDYYLPNSIVKFKQGFGRLIRSQQDRGCIICLDVRLVTKKYGQQFLNSLPPCRQVFGTCAEVKQEMENFYRQTYRPKA